MHRNLGKVRTRMGRVVRLSAILAVLATSSVAASTGPASAADGPSTMSTSCSIMTDRARTYYGVACDSDTFSESFGYYAYAFCTDGLYHFGGSRQSFYDTRWSVARCPEGTSYYYAGRG